VNAAAASDVSYTTTSDGVRLALARFAPPAGTARRRVALLTHAMMARGSYHGRFAAFLAEGGVEAWVLDFRGHGASVPPSAARGHRGWSFDDLVRRDLPAAFAHVARAADVVPSELCYVGHSLGGLAGLAAMGTGEVPDSRRLVLAAVNVWTRPRGRRALAALAFVSAGLALGHVPARTLRIGSDDEPRDYVRDFARWALRGFRARDATDYRAALTRVHAPTLALVGDGDWMCRPADVHELLRDLPRAPRVRCVGRRRGDAFDPDHFALLTDPRLAPVWRETRDFLLT
jgi:predicted alpha/beta hydrolase